MNELFFRPLATLLIGLLAGILLVGCRDGDAPPTSSFEAGPLRVSGGGVGQFREPGGDNTIEEYGHEGNRMELEAAAREIHAYLVALIAERWQAACSHLSDYAREQVIREASTSKHSEGKRCAKGLSAYGDFKRPRETTFEATKVDAGSLRIEGNFGFLFFNGAAGKKLALEREDGVWKAYGLHPTSLH